MLIMSLERVIRQAYRGYGVAAVVWAGWSVLWIGTDLRMDPSIVGYGWLAIAAFGALVGASMASMHLRGDALFRTALKRRQFRRFEDSALTGAPLSGYVAGLVAWAALTGAWMAGVGIDVAVVGYGWLAIALYGAGLTIALAVTHKRDLADAIDATTVWVRRA